VHASQDLYSRSRKGTTCYQEGRIGNLNAVKGRLNFEMGFTGSVPGTATKTGARRISGILPRIRPHPTSLPRITDYRSQPMLQPARMISSTATIASVKSTA
jgi:hypothetical protein